MQRRTLFILSLITLVACLYLITTASPAMVRPLNKANTFPLGTLITWVGIIALPASIFFGIRKIHQAQSKTTKVYRSILLFIVLLAGLWGFIVFSLAGNWAYNFSSESKGFRGSTEAGVWFWNFTYAVVLLPIAFLLVFLMHMLVTKLIGRKV